MDKTPQSNRKHVSIFGETNSGKSALFNAILGTDTSIVSEISGTTTDPVSKSMELLPFGPIVLTDTAGLKDNTNLGNKRMRKTKEILERTDLAIYTMDINDFDEKEYRLFIKEFESKKIPNILVFAKKDTSNDNKIREYSERFQNSIFVSIYDTNSINDLKEKIGLNLENQEDTEGQLINSIIPRGGIIVMVVPIDTDAPKGRLILPQVQLIRNCLDNGVRCNITTLEYLKDTLEQSKAIDLVVTDSQIFGQVAEIVPSNIPLTSFSILMARQKGDIAKFIKGANHIENLVDGDKVLISEVCTHNRSHEDIGRVKIPNAIKKITGKNIIFEFTSGHDYPENLQEFKIIIHCGACMVTTKEMKNRIQKANENNIPITNYGVVLAMASNILDRSIEIF